ncbi:hypothetical protein [Bradyrhizobium sp. ARR65]|uniref:hypothetical protein n=1 Tax=Bradyrhizobium sp. ARR65 TaxID=1040989 RepID=UPI0032DF613E
MMSKRAEWELLEAISVYFHHAIPRLGPDVEVYQNAEWRLRQRDKALRWMRYFDAVLRTQPFVAGEAFSMAHITAIGGLIFAAIRETVSAREVQCSLSLVRKDAGASQRKEPAIDIGTEQDTCQLFKARAKTSVKNIFLVLISGGALKYFHEGV